MEPSQDASLLERVRDQISKLREDIADRERELDRLLTAEKVIVSLLIDGGEVQHRPKEKEKTTPKVASKSERGKKPRSKTPDKGNARMARQSLIVAFKRILLDEGRPLQPAEVHRLALERGVEIHGGNHDHTVRRTLNEVKSVFVNTRGQGYWLKDVEMPKSDSDH